MSIYPTFLDHPDVDDELPFVGPDEVQEEDREPEAEADEMTARTRSRGYEDGFGGRYNPPSFWVDDDERRAYRDGLFEGRRDRERAVA